jgi:hypothetical protein
MVSYEGQQSTCYGCNETGHHLKTAHAKKQNPPATTNSVIWANVVTRSEGHTQPGMGTRESTDERSVDCEIPVPKASEDNTKRGTGHTYTIRYNKRKSRSVAKDNIM